MCFASRTRLSPQARAAVQLAIASGFHRQAGAVQPLQIKANRGSVCDSSTSYGQELYDISKKPTSGRANDMNDWLPDLGSNQGPAD
jgi:hypothetical protein